MAALCFMFRDRDNGKDYYLESFVDNTQFGFMRAKTRNSKQKLETPPPESMSVITRIPSGLETRIWDSASLVRLPELVSYMRQAQQVLDKAAGKPASNEQIDPAKANEERNVIATKQRWNQFIRFIDDHESELDAEEAGGGTGPITEQFAQQLKELMQQRALILQHVPNGRKGDFTWVDDVGGNK